MLDERILELINAEIDGELGSEERHELEAALAASDEARVLRAELRKLAGLLGDEPEQDPPADLMDRVMSQVQLPAAGAAKPAFSLRGLFASFQPATAGLAFAAGLLLTVAYYELVGTHPGHVDAATMVGSMVVGQERHTFAKNDISYAGDGYSGTVSLRRKEALYVLNFDLDSQKRTEIAVGLDGTGLSYGGFAQPPGGAGGAMDDVAIDGTDLRLSYLGPQQFAVFLLAHRDDQSVTPELITIEVSSEGDDS